MKKVILVCAVLLGTIWVYGQNPQIKNELPIIIPPSPTVAALMKFEEIPVSNYSGVPDIAIPLFNSPSHSKDINLDLSLKYHSGVGANDRASDVGLGWSLFAGGTISRTVRGLPDEQLVFDGSQGNNGKVGLYHTTITNHNNFYYEHGENFEQFGINQPFLANEYAWGIVESGKFDTEHDLWQFNFMGFTGRFYIKKNRTNGFLEVQPLDDYRIKIINNYAAVLENPYIPTGFTVFDEKGFKYIFDIIETTKNFTAVRESYSSWGNTMRQSLSDERAFDSAFHLSKVYDTNNNLIVEFLYNPNTTLRECTKNSATTYNDYIFAGIDLQLMRQYNCFYEFKPLDRIVNNYSTVSVKKIQTINILGVSKISFDYQQGRYDTNLQLKETATYLDNIIIRKWNDEIVKKYKFSYSYSTIIDTRMMLTKVEDITDSNKSLKHEFFYESNDFSSFNVGKDYWGYFNRTPACRNINTIIALEPSPDFSTTDLLQKIKYPTGGCSIFNFEANRYNFIGTEELTDFEENPDNYVFSSSETRTFNNLTQSRLLPISTNGNKKVTFYHTAISNEDPNVNDRLFKLRKLLNGVWIDVGGLPCLSGNCCTDFIFEQGVQYELRIFNFNNNFTGTDVVQIHYYSKNPIIKKFLYGGGNRIKQIGYFDKNVGEDYYKSPTNAAIDTPIKEKNYSYNLPNDSNKSSGSLVFAKPIFKYMDRVKINTMCPERPTLAWPFFNGEIVVMAYTNFNYLSALKTQGTDVGYKYVSVTEKNNGKIDFEYTSPVDFPEILLTPSTQPPFLPSKNIDYKRGLLLKETIKNQSADTIQHVNYKYDYVHFEEKYGFKRHKPAGTGFGGSFFKTYVHYLSYFEDPSCITIGDPPPSQYSFVRNCFTKSNLSGYPIFYSYPIPLIQVFGWAKLTSKNTKNYFYPNGGTVPKIVETNESYTYNPINKKIETATVNNGIGETIQTNYTYDAGNSIYSQNRISEIRKIETFKNGSPLSTTTINYATNFAGNASVLPQSISTKKGNGTEEVQIKFNKYDSFGNVLEVQQENGSPISYIYGYNQTLPVAKIENATYAQVQQYEANLQNLSNGTNEAALIVALNNLRTVLPNAMISTYTHKPLIGVSTVTDPKGSTTQYFYDSMNRLEYVLDNNGNKVTENLYNFKL